MNWRVAAVWMTCGAIGACARVDRDPCRFERDGDLGRREIPLVRPGCRDTFASWTLEELVAAVYLDPSLRLRSLAFALIAERPEPALAAGLAATLRALTAASALMEYDVVSLGILGRDDLPVERRIGVVDELRRLITEALVDLGPAGHLGAGL